MSRFVATLALASGLALASPAAADPPHVSASIGPVPTVWLSGAGAWTDFDEAFLARLRAAAGKASAVQLPRSLPWKLQLDFPAPAVAGVERGVGLARRLGEQLRAGLDVRTSRLPSIGEHDEINRHVLGVYLRIDLP